MRKSNFGKRVKRYFLYLLNLRSLTWLTLNVVWQKLKPLRFTLSVSQYHI